ncbi:MAG: lysine--tRNA ligase [Candidatus Taylorbacteria bacterium]|nr:lysine--tRNA ligase [Candidatus Taylorbacteria bacterium]
MASIEEIRNNRLIKLNALKEAGINPYPTKTNRSCDLKDATEKFEKLSKNSNVFLAGRIMSLRPQGGLIFMTLDDGSGRFQGLLKSDEISETVFNLFLSNVDIGDFIEIEGSLFVTKRSEKTLQIKAWKMLSKSLRPLPEKWHGLQDIEERFRHRYLDTLMSPEVKERFVLRSILVSEIREFYNDAGYIEVETPRLQTLAGGATALPFTTHHNALDIDFHLTIAQELYLKQLLVGGFTKVYEIGRKFRNEGIDTTHNPEFTMLESQDAYADAHSQREFIQKLFKHIVKTLFKKNIIIYNGQTIDFGSDFQVITFYDLLKRHALISNPEEISREELLLVASQFGVTTDASEAMDKILDNIYKKACRPKLIQPTFIIDYPLSFNPFAKRKEDNPKLIDRFQLVIGGIEIVNAFSELNNPIDQKERYQEQDKKRAGGEQDISPSDAAYLEAMEYGMPPNGGIGIGIDRFTMLLTDTKNIKEVILFPTLRPVGVVSKSKEGSIAVALINSGAKLASWQELNTVAHLTAALGGRVGKSLFYQDEIRTKDNEAIKLNIRHAIMIKEAHKSAELRALSVLAKGKGLEVCEFTREMLETTNDKKVIEATKQKNGEDVEYLGVLVFGPRGEVEDLTKQFKLHS